MSDASTPLMRQYNAVKQQVPNALLMFRLGDFYELFFEDAVTAARELEITLTSRNKEKGAAIPMCGVPYHAAEGYIARLIQKGYRVAICDQMEDPGSPRNWSSARSPASSRPAPPPTPHLLRSHENNYLAAVARIGATRRRGPRRPLHRRIPRHRNGSRRSRRRPRTARRARSPVRRRPAAALPPKTAPARASSRTELEDWVFTHDYADRTLRDHFKLLSLDGCGLANRPPAVGAAGAILHYLRDTQRAALDHLDRPTYYDRADSMVLDAVTVRNLELVEPLFAADAGGAEQATLLGVLDQTADRHGRPPAAPAPAAALARPRRNRSSASMPWANCSSRPSCAPNCASSSAAFSISSACWPRSRSARAGPRDVLALGRSLEKIPALQALLRHAAGRPPALACTTAWTNCPTSPT